MHNQMMTFRSRMTMRIPKRILVRSMSPRMMDDEDPEEDPMKNMSLRIRMLMRPNRLRRKRLLSYHHHLDTGLIRSPGHDAWTIARATDRVEDVGYVKALQAFERRMMTSIEEVNLRVTYQA
nr:hypothetical protein [Tanacetum cinerariifolium]